MVSPFSNPVPWDLVAAGYDEFVVPVFDAFASRAIALLDLPPASHVIDVACGPGTVSTQLAAGGHRVDAIDFSEAMLARLRAKLGATGAGRLGSVEVHLMDGQELRFEDDRFDAGLSMFGLMFFPDRARGFGELRRVTRPGGRIAISSWPPLDEIPPMRWLMGAVAQISPARDPDAPAVPPTLASAEAIREEMEAAGFEGVQIERFTSRNPPPPDVPTFWDSMIASSAPIALLRADVGEARWPELSARALEHLHATWPEDLDNFDMQAWIAVGDVPG